MKDVFIPFVNETRRRHNLVGKPAALVVDGHISRFSLETALLLINEGIHLIVIPAHSSNVLQPLDLGLNRKVLSRCFSAPHSRYSSAGKGFCQEKPWEAQQEEAQKR